MLPHRRIALGMILALPMVPTANLPGRAGPPSPPGKRPWIAIRGIYGGVPTQILDRGRIAGRLRHQRRLDRLRQR